MIKHILKSEDFANVVKTGAKYTANELALYAKNLGKGEKHTYIGLVVPKSVVRLATRRNYIRRVIYAKIRLEGKTLKTEQAIVIKYCKNLDVKNKKDLAASLNEKVSKLLKEANISRETNNI